MLLQRGDGITIHIHDDHVHEKLSNGDGRSQSLRRPMAPPRSATAMLPVCVRTGIGTAAQRHNYDWILAAHPLPAKRAVFVIIGDEIDFAQDVDGENIATPAPATT